MKKLVTQTISEEIAQQSQNWAMWLLAGLGLTISSDAFVGGLCLALAAASIMARSRKDQRKRYVMLGTAAMAAIMVAIIWPYFEIPIPVQFPMAVSGLFSRFGVSFVMKFTDRLEERAPDLADGVLDKINGKKDGDK